MNFSEEYSAFVVYRNHIEVDEKSSKSSHFEDLIFVQMDYFQNMTINFFFFSQWDIFLGLIWKYIGAFSKAKKLAMKDLDVIVFYYLNVNLKKRKQKYETKKVKIPEKKTNN